MSGKVGSDPNANYHDYHNSLNKTDQNEAKITEKMKGWTHQKKDIAQTKIKESNSNRNDQDPVKKIKQKVTPVSSENNKINQVNEARRKSTTFTCPAQNNQTNPVNEEKLQKVAPNRNRFMFQLTKSAKAIIKSYEALPEVNKILEDKTIQNKLKTLEKEELSITLPAQMIRDFKGSRLEIKHVPLNPKSADKSENKDQDFEMAKKLKEEAGSETTLQKIAPLFTQGMFASISKKLSDLGLGNAVNVSTGNLIPKNLTADKKETLRNQIENETFPRYNIEKKSNGDLVVISSMIVRFLPGGTDDIDEKIMEKNANTFCKVTIETTISKEELEKDPLVVSNVKCSVSPFVEGLDKMLKLNQLNQPPLISRTGNFVKARFMAIGSFFSTIDFTSLKNKFSHSLKSTSTEKTENARKNITTRNFFPRRAIKPSVKKNERL